ncbi:MAG: bifunctional 5,10-methylene-tetrahydrofolate dehydrogenase/5,10-methylene-tetrahydrofolate cyclohydrolase [Alloprevotella sp.]|nr:bifunctional 5,10-methylene-tetrahydrofolate dehydrogenase/5,10-methylene-tetrahydrofolate cyclohydrolase [Alloprevotella sp.]
MEPIILDGKKTAAAIQQRIAREVELMVQAGCKRPHLAAILVGNDGGSKTYVANKVQACKLCGFESTLIELADTISEAELLAEVQRLNSDASVDGFIVQLPLPKHIDERKVIEAIDYRKDVDGFTTENAGRLALGLPGFLSATPKGIFELLKHYGVETSGKHVVIIGRSNIVGKPLASLMLQKSYANATVTVCHSATEHLADLCRQADILVAAIGRPRFVTSDMVKDGAVVVDVGTTRVPDATRERGWRLCGDVDFDSVAPKCAYITPVPGGVGPMTISMLMLNTLSAAKHEYFD